MEEKNKWGRPAKITQQRIDAAEEVLMAPEEQNAIIHTDEDLFDMINENLQKKYRISHETLREYKAWKTLKDSDKQDLLDQFSTLIKKALRLQRSELFKSMKDDENRRQKRAWIIERKFEAWNLRNIGETTHKWGLAVQTEISDKDKADVLDFIKNNI